MEDLDITDLESYAMALVNLICAKLEAFETRMKDRLLTLLTEFRADHRAHKDHSAAINTMIRGHVCGLDPLVALSIFRLMLCIGIVLDYHTYPSCLRLAPCPLSRVFKYGMRFLGETVKARLDIDIYVLNV
ncbi:hypothetical protein BHM03_00006810 [Ensete ventricosum]|nr:hypothetical protein BHM03_00006810 [Ensete ventricosum]